jgi:predicted nucleic acid-binding protein
MPGDEPIIYWDSNVLLSYLNGDEDRLPIIDELFRRSRAAEVGLITSVISEVEVACVASEKTGGALDPQVEQSINELWVPASPINVVEFHELIATRARELIRIGLIEDRALKPIDAIHLASAESVGASELQTYGATTAVGRQARFPSQGADNPTAATTRDTAMSESVKPGRPREGRLKIDADFPDVLRAALQVRPHEKPKRKPRATETTGSRSRRSNP